MSTMIASSAKVQKSTVSGRKQPRLTRSARVAAAAAPATANGSPAEALLFRNVRVETKDFQGDTKFQIAFSSEFPGQQRATAVHEKWGVAKEGEMFTEILDHDEQNVDLSRFNGSNRASFLDEHVNTRHLGPVHEAKLCDDKMCRAVVECDLASRLSKTRCKQLRSGSRPNVSFGYEHTAYLGKRTLADGTTGHAFAWRGQEISSVAVPMDPEVGLGRSGQMCHCMGCNGVFDRAKLDDNYYCPDCAAADDPDEEAGARAGTAALMRSGRLFRFKSADGEEMISHREVEGAVHQELAGDSRFKSQDANGNTHSDYRVHDIHQGAWSDEPDNAEFYAIVEAQPWTKDSKHYAVNFSYDGSEATLGGVEQVEPRQVFEAVGRGLTHDMQLLRASSKKPYGDVEYADPGYQKDGKKRYPIDTKAHAKAAWSYINQEKNASQYTAEQLAHIKGKIKAACKKFGIDVSDERSAGTPPTVRTPAPAPVDSQRNANGQHHNFMPKTAAELATENPDAVAAIRAETETNVRAKITGESQTITTKLATRNKEINALADEAVKTYGMRWNGPEGQVFVVGERIRALQAEIVALPADHDPAEARTDFKRKLDLLIEGSRSPKNPEQAAHLPDELASRCSLKALYNRAALDAENGKRVPCFMPADGAEFEADKELRHKAQSFPRGMAHEMGGVCLPVNMPGYGMRGMGTPALRRAIKRAMKRDSLAGDYPTAGALVQPEFKFPTIEILRNWMALSKAGITILSGVIGNLTLPRQTVATVSQSLAEGVALAEYDQNFDQIRMTPHRIGSMQKYSRLALLQTTEDFEALVLNDHMQQNALRADYLVLNGQGANDEPLGIMNQPGISAVTFAGSASSAYKNLVTMETDIRKSNIDEEPSFITTSVGRGTLRITPATLTGSTVVSGQSASLWEGEELIERDAVDSQQMPGDFVVCLVGRHVVMAQWGGWQTVIDTLTFADQDKVRISMNTYIDACLRHPQAVCRSTDQITTLS